METEASDKNGDEDNGEDRHPEMDTSVRRRRSRRRRWGDARADCNEITPSVRREGLHYPGQGLALTQRR